MQVPYISGNRDRKGYKMRKDSMVNLAIRIPPAYIKRADALQPKLVESTRLPGLNQSDVFRICLGAGFEVLEGEHGLSRDDD